MKWVRLYITVEGQSEKSPAAKDLLTDVLSKGRHSLQLESLRRAEQGGEHQQQPRQSRAQARRPAREPRAQENQGDDPTRDSRPAQGRSPNHLKWQSVD